MHLISLMVHLLKTEKMNFEYFFYSFTQLIIILKKKLTKNKRIYHKKFYQYIVLDFLCFLIIKTI